MARSAWITALYATLLFTSFIAISQAQNSTANGGEGGGSATANNTTTTPTPTPAPEPTSQPAPNGPVPPSIPLQYSAFVKVGADVSAGIGGADVPQLGGGASLSAQFTHYYDWLNKVEAFYPQEGAKDNFQIKNYYTKRMYSQVSGQPCNCSVLTEEMPLLSIPAVAESKGVVDINGQATDHWQVSVLGMTLDFYLVKKGTLPEFKAPVLSAPGSSNGTTPGGTDGGSAAGGTQPANSTGNGGPAGAGNTNSTIVPPGGTLELRALKALAAQAALRMLQSNATEPTPTPTPSATTAPSAGSDGTGSTAKEPQRAAYEAFQIKFSFAATASTGEGGPSASGSLSTKIDYETLKAGPPDASVFEPPANCECVEDVKPKPVKPAGSCPNEPPTGCQCTGGQTGNLDYCTEVDYPVSKVIDLKSTDDFVKKAVENTLWVAEQVLSVEQECKDSLKAYMCGFYFPRCTTDGFTLKVCKDTCPTCACPFFNECALNLPSSSCTSVGLGGFCAGDATFGAEGTLLNTKLKSAFGAWAGGFQFNLTDGTGKSRVSIKLPEGSSLNANLTAATLDQSALEALPLPDGAVLDTYIVSPVVEIELSTGESTLPDAITLEMAVPSNVNISQYCLGALSKGKTDWECVDTSIKSARAGYVSGKTPHLSKFGVVQMAQTQAAATPVPPVNVPVTSSTPDPTKDSGGGGGGGGSKSGVAAAVIISLLIVAAIGVGGFVFWRKRRQDQQGAPPDAAKAPAPGGFSDIANASAPPPAPITSMTEMSGGGAVDIGDSPVPPPLKAAADALATPSPAEETVGDPSKPQPTIEV